MEMTRISRYEENNFGSDTICIFIVKYSASRFAACRYKYTHGMNHDALISEAARLGLSVA